MIFPNCERLEIFIDGYIDNQRINQRMDLPQRHKEHRVRKSFHILPRSSSMSSVTLC